MKRNTFYALLYVVLIAFMALLSSCYSSRGGHCKGNKTMSYHQGYSRKPFKF